MKIVTYLLAAVLVAALGAAAYFYLFIHQPVAVEFARMKTGMPELERAKVELKKYREKEDREAAWIRPALETLQSGLKEEITAGKAEVVAAGDRVTVNISEQALYTAGSKTFAKDSPEMLKKIASLLSASKDIKDKEIFIGNTTQSVPAQTKGRKKVPAKDGRTLAGERSAELVKYLEKNGVDQASLIAAAYPSKQPDRGFKIKDHKIIIIIASPPAPEPVASKPEAAAGQQQKTDAGPKESATPAAKQQEQPKQPIPIQQPVPKKIN